MINPYIPKEDQRIPDYYEIKIFYHDGKFDVFEGSHSFVKETNSYDILTKDDEWRNIPLTSIKKIEFDKNFSKLMALNQERVKARNDNPTL